MGCGERCHLGPHFPEDWACEEIVFSTNVITITLTFTEHDLMQKAMHTSTPSISPPHEGGVPLAAPCYRS